MSIHCLSECVALYSVFTALTLHNQEVHQYDKDDL